MAAEGVVVGVDYQVGRVDQRAVEVEQHRGAPGHRVNVATFFPGGRGSAPATRSGGLPGPEWQEPRTVSARRRLRRPVSRAGSRSPAVGRVPPPRATGRVVPSDCDRGRFSPRVPATAAGPPAGGVRPPGAGRPPVPASSRDVPTGAVVNART